MNWEVKKLGEVCDFQNRFAFKSNLFTENGIPVIRITNIQEQSIDLRKIVYVNLADHKQDLSRYKVNRGDILIAMSGATTGKIGIVDNEQEFLLNQRVGKFIPKSKLNQRFLYYYLLTKEKESLKISAGSAQPNLSTQQIKSFKIPVPPLEEQKRIVEILDESFAGIERAEAIARQNLTNARELFDSYLNKIFCNQDENWESVALGKIVNFLNGFAFKSQDTVSASNVQLVRMGNLYQNQLDLNRKSVFYPDHFKNEYSRYILKRGDLIMSLTGTVDKEDYGFTVEIPEHEGFLLLNQRIAKFIDISPRINREFLLYILRSKDFLKKLYSTSRGVRQANLSTTEIKKIDIHFPSLSIQEEEIHILKELEKSINILERIYQQKIEALAELKQSILQKAFTGQLTP